MPNMAIPAASRSFTFTAGTVRAWRGRGWQKHPRRHHVRLIAPDRPGFGLSDPHLDRTFLSWAADVAELADALAIDRFAVMGLSGGAPHAAVVAHQLPERVTAVALISGLAPPSMPDRLQGIFPPLRLNFLAARYAPKLNRWFLGQMSRSYADPDKFLSMVKRGMPKPDQILAEQRPEAIRQFSTAAVESHRQGVGGDFAEWQLYVRPWGFQLQEIVRPVDLVVRRGRQLRTDRNGTVSRSTDTQQPTPHGVRRRTFFNHSQPCGSDFT